MFEMAPSILARVQFAANMSFHILFPTIRIAFEALMPSRLHTQHTSVENNGAMKFQSLASKMLGFVTVAMGSGAIALYAVGTGWYWNVVRQVPAPIAAWIGAAVGRARPLLAEDTTVAEQQAEFFWRGCSLAASQFSDGLSRRPCGDPGSHARCEPSDNLTSLAAYLATRNWW